MKINFTKMLISGCLLLATNTSVLAQWTISGKTINAITKEPIAGAVVQIATSFLAKQSATDGSFTFEKLKAGTYFLKTNLLGFEPKQDTILLEQDKVLLIELRENTSLMEEIVVSSIRVSDKSAMAFSNMDKKAIEEQNIGLDLPLLLNQQVSMVTTTDAGAGVGYTGMRIRGTDATRINATINGIPVNDAESQGTYWVDMPDIASSIDNIQVQRGVGTSANGAGAFGASINIQTNKLMKDAYASYAGTYGSFNTFKNTISAGSGLLNNKFAMDVRLSKISSDGFIDRAKSDLKSYYLSGAYYGKKSLLKFVTFSGLEKTYQAWNGIPEARLRNDSNGMNNFILRNGLDDAEANNLLTSSSRTYNEFTYKNQIDNYQQTYYQLHFSHEVSNKLNVNVSLFYTKGKGYYEEYKKNQQYSNYGLENAIIGNDTIYKTNLVRRRWLDNDFYGTVFSVNYSPNNKLSTCIGGGYNIYNGLHFGEIIWAQNASNSQLYKNYYNDTATKKDFTIYAKASYLLFDKLSIFADLQYRTVDYTFLGFDNNLRNVKQNATMAFVNPKVGVNYDWSSKFNIYASYSIGNKEPSRNDFTQSTTNSRPKAETLNDLEFGFKHRTRKIQWGINVYDMQYTNQLVLTGKVNDVGAYNRTNVSKSYRRGVELEAAMFITKKITWNMNLTLSNNKIIDFYDYTDTYDADFNYTGQVVDTIASSDIAFSPNVIGASTLTFELFKNFKLSYITKYVGKQYLDNTSNEDRKLNTYIIDDIRLNYTIKTKAIKAIEFTLGVYNIFNKAYESNGYTYGYNVEGKRTTENFYYPQAGINFLFGVKVSF